MDLKKHPNVGRRVRYTPVGMCDEDAPTEGVVEQYCPAGSIFRMDMLVIDSLDHWIPAHECEFISTVEEKSDTQLAREVIDFANAADAAPAPAPNEEYVITDSTES